MIPVPISNDTLNENVCQQSSIIKMSRLDVCIKYDGIVSHQQVLVSFYIANVATE